MQKNEDLAIAGLLHDIGKFAQRAKIDFRSSVFSKTKYNYLHAGYSAQVMEDYFDLDSSLIDYSAMHHNLCATNGDDEYWVVASADRLASGFEREKFEDYNAQADNEDFRTQRLKSIFNEDNEYKISSLNVNNIFSESAKSNENEYIKVWNDFLNDLAKIEKGNRLTDLSTIEYLLKKHTTFMPSSTSFKKGSYDAVKANIPLYDHLKTTAIFAGAIEAMDKSNKDNILNYYKNKNHNFEQNDFLLIAGDFFGIQKFIFDSLVSKNASKILRAKSAYIQILTKIIAINLANELKLSRLSIISDSAGKFEILAPNSEENKNIIQNFQKKLSKHFLKEFYGETGIGVCAVQCGLNDFIQDKGYEKVREKLAKEVEKTKYKKFDLINEDEFIFNIDNELNNQNLCPLCNKKKKEDKQCPSCSSFIAIGKELSRGKFLAITKDKTDIEIFNGYYIKFINDAKVFKNSIAIYDLSNDNDFRGFAKWELSSYVATDNDGVMEFDKLAKNSVLDGMIDEKREHGVQAIMALKGDVDDMGKFIKNPKFGITKSFAKFNFFSRMVDYYFSVYVPYLMEEKYPNTYTVFAGGDDLFLLGAWDEVINLSKDIRNDFIKFCENKLTFSAGAIMVKSSKPVNYIADTCEEQLELAKEHNENSKTKDAISIFGETIKWYSFIDDKGLIKKLDIFKNNTSFLYRILELIDMSKKVKGGDIEATIWKSKLNYSFYRNMDMKNINNQEFLKLLNEMIEKYPEQSRVFLSQYIYKRRIS